MGDRPVCAERGQYTPHRLFRAAAFLNLGLALGRRCYNESAGQDLETIAAERRDC